MSSTQRTLLVGVLSLGLLLLLLLLVAVGNFFDAERPETISFREVTLATPPPPPPPPPDSRADASVAPVNLSAANPESPVLMLNMDLQVELPEGQVLGTGDGWGRGGEGIGLAIDWSGFSLTELDGEPIVLSAPVFPFPRDFVNRSIKEINVRLHILIDESGRAYLVRVVEAPDISLNDNLDKFVQGVRFTPPTVSGVVVKAEFIWPVTFRSQ